MENVSSKAFGVVLQHGKIVAGGEATSSTASGSAVVRYLPDGSLDSSFGNGGVVFSTQPGENGFAALALQPDDKILGVGRTTPLTRYDVNGSLDTSFGSGGISGASTPGAEALASQADGKLVVAGGASNSFVLARVNLDGSVDPSFGSDGVAATPMGSGGAESFRGRNPTGRQDRRRRHHAPELGRAHHGRPLQRERLSRLDVRQRRHRHDAAVGDVEPRRRRGEPSAGREDRRGRLGRAQRLGAK